MPEYVLIFTLGLMGSAHCIGMCGGFMLAVAGPGTSPTHTLSRQLLYLAGKTLTYIVLGGLAGWAGAALGSSFAAAQDALSWAVGITLIGIGLSLCGLLERVPGLGGVIRLHGLQRWVTHLLGRGSSAALFGLGLVNGLLPCGLVYAMVAVAATSGSMVEGALVMAIFGLATVPALMVLGLTKTIMPVRWRVPLNRVGGVLVLLLGLLTVVRGTPLPDHLMHRLHHQHAAVEAEGHSEAGEKHEAGAANAHPGSSHDGTRPAHPAAH